MKHQLALGWPGFALLALAACAPAPTPVPLALAPTATRATVLATTAPSTTGRPNAASPVPIAPTQVAPTSGANAAVGGISKTAAKIALEQGSGAACTAKAAYAVTVDLTSSGPTSAKYEISATDASGQVEDGSFDKFGKPYVTDAIRFAAAETKTISLRLVGPYSYPNAIVIRVRVNGGDPANVALSCNTGTGQASVTGSTAGITKTTAKIAYEQGSGAICTGKASYLVTVDITSNGATSAKYEVSATDASGQVPDGVFDKFAAPYVTDAVKFAGAETKTIALRLVGPYAYPNAVTIRVMVNGEPTQTAVACK
jgi:hypothetical protein